MSLLVPILFVPIQAAIPSAPPKPTRATVAMPMIDRMTFVPASPRASRRLPLDIVIRAPEGVLWQGILVTSERGSSFSQSRTEADDEACGGNGYRFGERDGLNLQLGLLPADDAERVSVTLRWTRPADGPCAGTRVVELRQVASIVGRERTVLRGDAGLIVELRRR